MVQIIYNAKGNKTNAEKRILFSFHHTYYLYIDNLHNKQIQLNNKCKKLK